MLRRFAAPLLVLALLVPGCRAYDGRYMSFPLNSVQMVDNAVTYKWTYGEALAAELGFQLFPWTWIASIVDIVFLPISSVHDLYALIANKPHEPFAQQVIAKKRHGLEYDAFKNAEDASKAGAGQGGPNTSPSLSPTDD